jgi:pimeloyl-ACP methyl ester carboxylesterase
MMKHALASLSALLPLAWADAAAAHCAVGSYRLADGGFVDIAPARDNQLRWRRPDGTTGALTAGARGTWTSTLGWTGRPHGTRVSFDCPRRAIAFNGARGRRIAFDVTETQFAVEGAILAGRLVMPPGNARAPVVVLIHGAERDSAREAYALQRMFPAAGIGAFVFDKRGTGGSSGRYTHDYLTLAVDAVAAVREARRLAGDRAGRIGYQAGSQGGWTAPLAAHIAPVDFVIVGFGLAASPAAAERDLIAADLARAGYGAEETTKAMEVATAIETIVESGFQSGYDELATVRARYGSEPWFGTIRGSVAAPILSTPEDVLRRDGPGIAPSIPLYYDPMPVLRALDTPQLWLLGGEDIVAPPGETARRLAALARAGRPITAAIFPRAEHGMYEYEIGADGARLSTRASAGYFAMMRDFIFTGRSGPQYGAEIVAAP